MDVETVSFRRRNLPHWYVAGRTFFVTFRLKGSLPASAVSEIRAELDRLLKLAKTDDEWNDAQSRVFLKMEAVLDAAKDGPLWLRQPAIARIVMNGFEWLEREKGWKVFSLAVMPNHVHCLLRHDDGMTAMLGKHLGVLKGYTAREANVVLGREGQPFWLGEVFDHWCRSDQKVEAARQYIRQNPVKAGLVGRAEDWPWSR